MADQLRNTIARFAIIFLVIMLGFAGVIAMIIYIQTSPAEKEKWSKIEATQEQTNLPIEPARGNILDANGNLLASSLPQYVVYMDTRVEALHLGGDTLFNKYIDSIANGLSRIIGDKSPQEYKRKITTAFRSKSKEIKVRDIRLHSGRISYVQKQQIQQLPLIKRGVYKSGIHFDEQHVRKKPFGRLGSRTIGSIYREGGYGNAGLEKSFESTLHGVEGISTKMRVAGYWTNVPIKEAENGDDIVTTLDVNLMDICETTLEKKLKEVEADWGCILLMEAHSGQIKAIINLDRQVDGTYYETMNHAVTRVEPGSTFKTIAMMAALDDDKIQIDDTFRVYSGGWDYLSSHHTDSHPKDTVYTTRSALAISSNIALAKMIIRSYEGKAERFVKKLDKMGVTKNFYSEIPGSTPPRIDVPNDAVTLSKMAYGYSVELSPMQILAFYNGIANNGKMIRPYMVSRTERNGDVKEEFDTEVLNSSLCKSRTLRDIKSGLHDVVWDNNLPGTASVRKWGNHIVAYKAQSELVHIAGKTGTAQLFHHGRYHSKEHRMTFVGYFPEENPEYTCLCMIEHPHVANYDAGYDCGNVVREIAERTMAYGWVYEIKDGQTIFKKR